MYPENWNVELLEKITEKSSLVGWINYFKILKALTILFLLYIRMNYVPNQNMKVQEETLADSNSDIATTTLRLCVISNWPPSYSNSSKISAHSSIVLSHTLESITKGSVG